MAKAKSASCGGDPGNAIHPAVPHSAPAIIEPTTQYRPQRAAVLRVAPESVGQLLHRAKQRLARLVPHLAHWVESPRKP